MVFAGFFRSNSPHSDPPREHSEDEDEAEEDDDYRYDKLWATRYILDPLTAPEPSQVTGPGTSHVHLYKRLAKAKAQAASQAKVLLEKNQHDSDNDSDPDCSATSNPQAQSPSQQTQRHRPLQLRIVSRRHSASRLESLVAYHTPPPPPSCPTDCGFDIQPSNPFPTSFWHSHSSESHHLGGRCRQSLRTPPGSVAVAISSYSTPARTSPILHSLPVSPPSSPPSRLRSYRNGRFHDKYAQHHLQRTAPHYPLRRLRRCPSFPPTRASLTTWGQPNPERLRSQLDKARRLTQINANRPNDKSNGHYRNSFLGQRHSGDMSHRPLEMIKRDAKAADRHHRHRRRISDTDTIDALDTIGGAYHHGGPYDATLISRNLDKKYSPVAAVEESNMEAIRATPRENIMDSLTKHVPLQGTASIPDGAPDMTGKIMHYKEGADLMREPDAAGGAYKRWDGIQYHPDDLKGKGEPSFTVERDLKKEKGHRQFLSEADAYEMRPGSNRSWRGTSNHQRSSSQTGEGISSGATYTATANGDLRRSNTTGNKISEGLKRRFGSLRRKKEVSLENIK